MADGTGEKGGHNEVCSMAYTMQMALASWSAASLLGEVYFSPGSVCTGLTSRVGSLPESPQSRLHAAMASIARPSLPTESAMKVVRVVHVFSCPLLSLSPPCPSLVFSKIPRKTSKTPRSILTLRTLKYPGKWAENTQKTKEIPSKRNTKETRTPRKRRTGRISVLQVHGLLIVVATEALAYYYAIFLLLLFFYFVFSICFVHLSPLFWCLWYMIVSPEISLNPSMVEIQKGAAMIGRPADMSTTSYDLRRLVRHSVTQIWHFLFRLHSGWLVI